MDTPKSLQAFAQHQAAYQQQLMRLPYYRLVQPVIENFLKQIISHGAFYLRVPVSALQGILESQSIKSMMETGTGATNGGKEARKEVTQALFGCDVNTLQPNEFPKYGFLSQPDAVRDLAVNADMWSQYGDVSIQLKKSNLMHRTTLTVGNSVNLCRHFAMVPTRVDDVKATCICGLPHHGTPLERLPDPIVCYAMFATWIAERRLTVDNFAKLPNVVENMPPMFEFFELQYHGDISITRDVERIDVIPSSSEEKETLALLKEQFEAIGVKMYISEGW